jgi:hypothetical protein
MRTMSLTRLFLVVLAGVGTLAALAAAPPAQARKKARVVLTRTPPPATTSTKAVFRFRGRGAGRARCRLDGGRVRRCSRKVVYRRLSPGFHKVVVRPIGRRKARKARYAWAVVAPPAGQPAPAPPPPPPPAAPPGRKLLYADEFDGTRLDTSAWRPYDSDGNAGYGLRRPSAIALDGQGHLVITAQTQGGQLVSGGMSNRLSLNRGRVEFRVRTDNDPTQTMSGVVLTWPDSGKWPQDGENDIYETGHKGSRNPFHSFVHYGASNEQYSIEHAADGAEWHVVAMEWTPQALEFYRDGALVGRVDDPKAIPRTMHHVCIQLDAFAERTLPAPVRMQVDWLRIYA